MWKLVNVLLCIIFTVTNLYIMPLLAVGLLDLRLRSVSTGWCALASLPQRYALVGTHPVVLAGIRPGSQVSRSRFHCSGSWSWV